MRDRKEDQLMSERFVELTKLLNDNGYNVISVKNGGHDYPRENYMRIGFEIEIAAYVEMPTPKGSSSGTQEIQTSEQCQ